MANPFIISMKFVADAGSVTAAASQSTTALDEVTRSVTNAGAAGAAAGRQLSEALNIRPAAFSLQQAVNSNLGVRDDFDAASRGADIAAYGQQLDALRAKYNPLFAAIRDYKQYQVEVREANALGAISEDEMSDAIDRQRTATLAQIAALKNLPSATRVGTGVTGAGAAQFQATNIAAQFQDIGVTSAMGMSPLQIALQQGTQLAAALGNQGVEGTVEALGKAFASLVNPVSLVTIGVVALAAAGIEWALSIHNSIKSADEALKEHEAVIRDVGDAYGGALRAAKGYAEGSGTLLLAASREDAAVLAASLRQAGQDFISQVGIDTSRLVDLNGGVGILIQKRFEPFEAELQTLIGQIKEGKPDFDAFYAAVNGKVDADESLRKVGDELILDTKNMRALGSATTEASQAVAGLKDQLANLPSAATVNAIVGGSFSALAGQKSDAQFSLSLDSIGTKSPVQQGEIAYRQKLLDLDGQDLTYQQMLREAEQARQLAVAQASNAITSADTSRLRSANDNIAAQRLSLALIGDSIEQAQRLQFVQQQLASAEDAAAQSGTTVSAAYRAEVEKLGAAYGRLQQQIALKQLSDDLDFDRAQLGRTSDEQAVASQLRPIFGDDQTSGQALFYAQQIRVNQALTQMKDETENIANGALSTFLGDLRNGTSLFGSLADAASSAFQQIAGDFFKSGIDQLISGAFSGSSSGGGLAGTLINGALSLFGLGGGSGLATGALNWAGLLPHNAAGTSDWRGGLTGINEKGGEIVDLPSGTRIYPHDVSMAMADAANSSSDLPPINLSQTVNVSGNGVTRQDVDQAIAAANEDLLRQLPDAIQGYNAHKRRRA